MSLPPPDYHTSRTIGTGRSNPADVRRLRRTLSRLGYGRFGNPPAENVTPGLMDATARFQSDFGLEPDSVIRPGGPTERTLAMALRARNEGGEAAQAALRDAFARRAAAGLTFEPDPENRNAGRWRDSAGRIQADGADEDRADKFHPVLAQNSGQGRGVGVPRRGIGRGLLLPFIIQLIEQEIAKERWKQKDEKPSPEKKDDAPSDAKMQAVPMDRIDPPLPPLPPKPLHELDGGEELPEGPPKLPDDDRKPVEGPKPPDKLIYTPLEDEEFWNQVRTLRRWGNAQTQELNDRVGRRAVEIAKEYGCNLTMTHGGFGDKKDENGKPKYQSELRLPAKGKLRDPRNSLINNSWVDVVLKDAAEAASKTARMLLINTVDAYARTGALKPREVWQETKVMQNKKTDDMFITIPKPRRKRGKVDLDEYVRGFDSEIRAAVKQFCSRIKNNRGAESSHARQGDERGGAAGDAQAAPHDAPGTD